jgi:hypothetical protein
MGHDFHGCGKLLKGYLAIALKKEGKREERKRENGG